MLINSVINMRVGGAKAFLSLARFKRSVFGIHSRPGSAVGGRRECCLNISAKSDFGKGV